jgi:hypothetical protein
MLRLTVHTGLPSQASRYNRTDWLDIGYDDLNPMANYKIVLFQAGIGAGDPVILWDYPRWSASLWDLAARSIAVALWPPPAGQIESVLPAEHAQSKRFAFADNTTAIIEHLPAHGTASRQLATMLITHGKKARGVYGASVDEDLRERRTVAPFLFAPAVLRPIELVLRTSLFMLHGSIDALPARPKLIVPPFDEEAGKKYLRLSRLTEPQRSGLVRWIRKQGWRPQVDPSYPAGRVPEEWYSKFMQSAL